MSKMSKGGRTQVRKLGKHGFDRRLMGRAGGASAKEIAKTLAALPDVAEEGEWVDAPQKAEAGDGDGDEASNAGDAGDASEATATGAGTGDAGDAGAAGDAGEVSTATTAPTP